MFFSRMFGPYNALDYGNRVYDPRAGRFLGVDPLTKSYPALTSYQFASNSPIRNSDLDGLENIDEVRAFQARQLEMAIKTREAVQNAYEQKMNIFNNASQGPISLLRGVSMQSPAR